MSEYFVAGIAVGYGLSLLVQGITNKAWRIIAR